MHIYAIYPNFVFLYHIKIMFALKIILSFITFYAWKSAGSLGLFSGKEILSVYFFSFFSVHLFYSFYIFTICKVQFGKNYMCGCVFMYIYVSLYMYYVYK
jgi:hypothetical protein